MKLRRRSWASWSLGPTSLCGGRSLEAFGLVLSSLASTFRGKDWSSSACEEASAEQSIRYESEREEVKELRRASCGMISALTTERARSSREFGLPAFTRRKEKVGQTRRTKGEKERESR
eukprot:1037775-Pleurochrysis_carterae.AAC.2